MSDRAPSVDAWLAEAKADGSAAGCGMYLIHNGTVRQTSRAAVREGAEDAPPVTGMLFSYDPEKVARAVEETRRKAALTAAVTHDHPEGIKGAKAVAAAIAAHRFFCFILVFVCIFVVFITVDKHYNIGILFD